MGSEVLIIGGGVIGLSIARALAKQGLREIAIVDRGRLGGESSWAAAGMLAPNIETESDPGFHSFGVEALEMYPAFAAELIAETGIDIELDQSGTLCLAFDDSEAADLRDTFQRQRRRGVAVEHLSSSDARAAEPSLSTRVSEALFYPSDWQVDNRKLLAALTRYADVNGIRMIEGTEVSELIVHGGCVTGARTAAGDLEADSTVVATGAWTSLIKIGGTGIPVDVVPIRGQMISFDAGERSLHRVVYSRRGYVVPRADGRVLVGATVEDVGFEKGTTESAAAELKAAAIEIMPGLGELSISDHWSGLRPFAADGLPVIGGIPGYENVVVATAHYRNGILLAPLTAQIVAEKIVTGKESDHFRVFGIDRFSRAAANGGL